MTISLHEGDLPDEMTFTGTVAIDTETMGLRPRRDRLCLVQLSAGDGNAHLVRIPLRGGGCPRLGALLANQNVTKLFHFARFDLGVLTHTIGPVVAPIYCTKIASKLARTYTDRHGLKDLCRELLGIELSKEQQSSDWGAPKLTDEQKSYAAADVLYLHRLRSGLDVMLAREGRDRLARECFDFLPTRVALDLAGWADDDIFAH
jgi:ribonuclease D